MRVDRDKANGRLKELRPNFFAYTWADDDSVFGGYGANQGFVVLEDSVLVFDSGFAPFQTKSLCRAISSVTEKKIGLVVNSHDHCDHVFGNFLLRRKNKFIRILSHKHSKNQLESLGHERLQGYRSMSGKVRALLSSVSIEPPSITYSDLNPEINIGGTEIVFIHPETGAHTLGDTALAFPSKGVVFAGDLLWNRFFPNLEDANLEGWIETLGKMDLATYQRWLPGHGLPCGSDEVKSFRQYLVDVKDRIMYASKGNEFDQKTLRACFESSGTEKWQLRQIVDWNIEHLFPKLRQKPSELVPAVVGKRRCCSKSK